MFEVSNVSYKTPKLFFLIWRFWKKYEEETLPSDTVRKALLCVVRRHLTPPPSSTNVERLFSVGGLTATDHRSALSGEKLDQILFLRENSLMANFKLGWEWLINYRSLVYFINLFSELIIAFPEKRSVQNVQYNLTQNRTDRELLVKQTSEILDSLIKHDLRQSLCNWWNIQISTGRYQISRQSDKCRLKLTK